MAREWTSPVRRSDIKDTAMDDGAFRLYCLLVSMADDSGGCYPSNKTMAKDLGCKSTRTIQQRLERLEKLGRIKRTLDGSGHGREKIFVVGFRKHRFDPCNEIRGGANPDAPGERNQIRGGTQSDAPKVLPRRLTNEGVPVKGEEDIPLHDVFLPGTGKNNVASAGSIPPTQKRKRKRRAAEFDQDIRYEAAQQRGGGPTTIRTIASSPLIQDIEPFA